MSKATSFIGGESSSEDEEENRPELLYAEDELFGSPDQF